MLSRERTKKSNKVKGHDALPYIMRRIIFSLLIVCSTNLFARGNDLPVDVLAITPYQVSQIFNEQHKEDIKTLPDLVDKEEKVSRCVAEYIVKQSKSYSKIAQSNLYDLMNNFNSIVSRIYGKKKVEDDIPYEDKVEALAIVQCEAYYAIGALK